MTGLFYSTLDDRRIDFKPPPWVSLVAVASLSPTALIAIFIYLGIWLGTVTTVSIAVATCLWLSFGYTRPVTRRLLPAHILLITVNLMLGAELYITGYAGTIKQAFPALVQPSNLLTGFSLALLYLSATAIWLLGAALAFYHIRVGGFTILLLAVWSVILPLSNLAMPLLTTAAQVSVPGMFNGPIAAILGCVTIRFAWTNRNWERPA